MTIECTASLSDIPASLATSAFDGTSWTPERRGASVQQDYVSTVRAVYDMVNELLEKYPGYSEESAREDLERFTDGYRSRYIAWLSAHSRVVSWMIAGPSNFPVRAQQKKSETADRRLGELIAYQKKWTDRLARDYGNPAHKPIRTDDANALDRLKEKLEERETWHAHMITVNKAWRTFEKSQDRTVFYDLGVTDKTIDRLIDGIARAYSWEKQPYPSYHLSNNKSEINRLKGRVEALEHLAKLGDAWRAKSEDGSATRKTELASGAVVIENVDANRVQIQFPGKPAPNIITELKRSGFRWSPSQGVWQAYLKRWNVDEAKRIAA